jgi:ABC-type multidrug transport system fused ATPase/permease subunit
MRNFSNAEHEKNLHASYSDREFKADSKRLLTLIQLENYRRLSLVLVGAMMLASLIWGWSHNIVSVGQLSAIMGQTFQLVGATWMFGWGVIMAADEMGYIDDGIRTLTKAHEIDELNTAPELKISNGSIEFRNVCFHYTDQPVFTDLSLLVPPQKKIGLIGHSGAGKSTLVSLLLRLYDVQGGKIFIDGQDISRVSGRSLRNAISYIPQDTSLFHRSLLDNIRYGRLEATEEEVMEAARMAYAHEFIMRMPEGYNTMVGERGVRLSGGERQRVAIARAILKNAPILILDEATSSLDSESERHIQQSLSRLMEGKTVIAIAHRLSTIVHMDELIVLDKGGIAEQGSHQDLLDRKGLYHKIWSLQSGGFIQDNWAA